jgi:methylenetetrahydrofolate dehydrogenase (NADP+) / methenyltetrahydrofolate cyclohydrolase
MPAVVMDGAALARKVRERVAAEVAAWGHVGLSTVLVGEDPASQVYIGLKHKAATEAGFEPTDHRLPASTSEEDLLRLVRELNGDDAVDGVLVQLPLPGHIDEGSVLRAIDPVKDVDGVHPLNAGFLALGTPTIVPATPRGCIALLDEYGVELEGARTVVIGRSNIVGKPVAQLLVQRNATVTVCHSRTRDLPGVVREAEIVVAAVGRPRLVQADWVRPGAAVVDVGVNRTEEGLAGDVDPSVAEVARLLSPVPGGVGPMTIAMLLENTLRAARLRRDGGYPGNAS